MGSDLSEFLALLPLGVTLRERNHADLASKVIIAKDKYQVSLDKNNEYTFTNADFCLSDQSHRVFYDKNDKILEYTYDGKLLSLDIFSVKQANLFIDISTSLCSIQAMGPLCIRGQFNIESELVIKASSLSFDGVMTSQNSVVLSATEGLSLSGEVDTKAMIIRAGHCHQFASVLVHEHCDIALRVFRQTSHSSFKTNTLRLIADICKIEGQMEVHSASFLVARHLLLGDLNNQTSVCFPAQHHVHVEKCLLIGHTEVAIGRTEEVSQNSQWLVDETVTIGSQSQIKFHHTHIHCNKMDNQGELFLKHCRVNIKNFYMESGCFDSFESSWIGNKLYVFAGKWIVKDKSMLVLEDKLLVDMAVIAEMTRTEVRVANQILFFGESNLTNSHLKTKDLFFHGHLRLKNLVIDATSVEYQSSNARLTKNYVKAKQILLSGSTKEKKFIFKNSRLVAKYFAIDQHVYMDESSMIGIDDAKVAHIIQGQLMLNNSRLITDSRICSLMGAHIHLCGLSEIISSSIDSSGALSIDDSLVQCDDLNLQQATTKVHSGFVYVSHHAEAKASLLALDEGSELFAENMHISHNSQLRLKKSNLFVAHEIVSSFDSKVQSEASHIVSKKIVFQGPTALTNTLLSAEELLIYELFLTQYTRVHADKKIIFADTAQAKIINSALSSQTIGSFGHLNMTDSQADAKHNMSLWTGSRTILEGETIIKAHDNVVRGELKTQKSNSKNSALKPTIIAENRLDISKKANITGNEDLCLLASLVNKTGKIKLKASLVAKGRLFNNVNELSADSVDLGFDDAVVNQGSISAKNIKIHSNLMNIFGRIGAEESMISSGFLNFNMGLIAANNYMNDSLVSMNMGIIAPNLLADPRFIFSRNNLISTARTFAMMWAPVHTSGIQLAFTLHGFYWSSVDLYEKTKEFTRIFDLKRHEYMPILCKMKSLMLLGHGMYASGNSLYNQEHINWQTSFSKLYNNPNEYGQDWYQTVQHTNWQDFGLNSAETFAGSYTDTSLIHANLGISLEANTSKTNWIHVNIGQERSLFTHNIATNILCNRGQSTGSKSSFTAASIQNQGTLSGTEQFYLRSTTVDNTGGSIKGVHASIDIEKLEQNGELVVYEGRVHIDALQNRKDAKTTLNRVILDGKTLESTGYLDLNHSYVREKEHFITSTSDQFKSDDVRIETGKFHVNGQLDYQHHLFIKASSAVLGKGSVVNGQKTEADQLFIQPSEDNLEAKPTLNPQHILIIEAPKVKLDGNMSGGDYIDIHGEQSADGKDTTPCETLTISDPAMIGLSHGRIKTHALSLQGSASFNDFILEADVADIKQDSKPEFIDTYLIGHSVTDESRLAFCGDSGVIADDYQHSGYYAQFTQDGKKSTFSVKAKTANLQGGGDLDHAVFQIDHFENAAEFIAGIGAYSNYHTHQSLGFSTLDDVSLIYSVDRDCDITVQAASIENQFDYDKPYQLSFISTVGDITFLKTLQGSNVYVFSARDILNRGQVFGTDKVFFQAKRNVENRGKIASGKYTQILAKGNVTNLCEEEIYQGQWDKRRDYRAAVIIGGTGEDTEGIGLHIEADGEVLSDASDFLSQGSNYIQGKNGVHFGVRYHTYTSLENTDFIHCGDPHKSRWNLVNDAKLAWDKVRDKRIETIAIDTDVGLSHIQSANGRNIVLSEEGEVSSVGTQFVSPMGTDIYAKGDVKLYSLQLNNKVHQNTNYRISLFDSSRDYYYQLSQPTLFLDNGLTRIHSFEGNVDASGAYFIGGGELEIKAKKKVFLGVDILDHETEERVRSFEWSMFGKGAWDTYKQGGKIWNIGAAIDPSLNKVNTVYRSQSEAERLASTVNLGIDLVNTGNSLMRGIAKENITDELLARYGLGHDGHIAPSITLSLAQRKSKASYQTQAQGGIDRGGNVTIEAGGGFELKNGARIHTLKKLDVNTPEIRAHAANLHSSTQQTTINESIGIVGLDGVESLGASYNHTKTSAANIVNAELSACGGVHLHYHGGEVDVVELDGANIDGDIVTWFN